MYMYENYRQAWGRRHLSMYTMKDEGFNYYVRKYYVRCDAGMR
jgi:hypothetical protein